MEFETITAINNAAEEYKRYAGILCDTLEYLMKLKKSLDEDDETITVAADKVSQQIQELLNITEAMESMSEVYRRAKNLLGETNIDFGDASSSAEFGISEFGNLSKHEKLMPIHSL